MRMNYMITDPTRDQIHPMINNINPTKFKKRGMKKIYKKKNIERQQEDQLSLNGGQLETKLKKMC